MPTFDTPAGSLQLATYPETGRETTQPWNSADDYLLSEGLSDIPSDPHQARLLIINDNWGALSCPFAQLGYQVSCYTDSFCSRMAISHNQQRNDIAENITLINDLTEASQDTDSIYIQLPKSFDSLHFWLSQLIDAGLAGKTLFIAGMAKHIPIKWLNWLENHCQNYQQFPIRKKARLMTVTLPDRLPELKTLKGYEYNGNLYQGYPGVFARDHLDIGSRVLLEHLPENITGHVVDLGCGNGLLAKEIHRQNPDIKLTLCDDSAVAIRSAQENLADIENASFIHTDALQDLQQPADWIICNPPFHKGNQVLTDIAQRMFAQAAQKLNKGGKLLVIANRHLPYSGQFKRHFGGFKVLHKDAKFSLYLCVKR